MKSLSDVFERLVAGAKDARWLRRLLLSLGTIASLNYIIIPYVLRRWTIHDKRRAIERERARRAKNFEDFRSLSLSGPQVKAVAALINLETFDAVRGKLLDGSVELRDVVRAYQHNLLRAENDANPVSEYLLDANGRAEELQRELRQGVITFDDKPLLGLTFSCKDRFTLAGTQSTGGLVQNLDATVGMADSFLLDALRHAGAVGLCKCNSSQGNMSLSCSNPIYGMTQNPYEWGKSPGGSSGGDAVVTAYAGVTLGVGTDIGGSVRIPATFCGVAGLKVTSRRLGHSEMKSLYKGRAPIEASFGFMSKETKVIAKALKSVLTPYLFRRDPEILPTPFDTTIYTSKKPLRIGFYTNDGFFPALPACVTAVNKAKAILKKKGHTLTPFEFPDAPKAMALYVRLMRSRLVDIWDNVLPYEPSDTAVRVYPAWARYTLGVALRPLTQMILPRSIGALNLIERSSTAHDLYLAMGELEVLKKEFNQLMADERLDAILCPAFGVSTPKTEDCRDLLAAASYTSIYNLLDLPAGVVPVHRVSEADEAELRNNYDTEHDFSLIRARRSCLGALGMPVSAQIVGRPYEEELVLRLMKEVEESSDYVQPMLLHEKSSLRVVEGKEMQ